MNGLQYRGMDYKIKWIADKMNYRVKWITNK